METVTIYPIFNALYYSFYIEGLNQYFGNPKLKFSTLGFPNLHRHCLAFVIKTQEGKKRIYISAGDGVGINQEGLDWCDIYAKVNLDYDVVPKMKIGKIIAIGPSFGIHYLSFASTIIFALRTYLVGISSIENPRDHFVNYYRQWKYQLPLRAYQPCLADNDYVFFAASLWKKEIENNQLRANFVEACHSISDFNFEGGLAPRIDVPEFKELFITHRYGLNEYIEKTKASFVVFNTPANQSCLGWKLGEFLALGKAIISTPLSHPMPEPLVHGINVHFVDGSVQSIQTALRQLHDDIQYRKRLEEGAIQYFKKYLHPRRVIERIINVTQGNHKS